MKVSLLNGEVDITPKKDGAIDPVRLLKATYESGVTVAEMTMVASGTIVKDPSGTIAIEVHTGRSYPIVANNFVTELTALEGKNVTLRGVLYTKPAKKQKDLPSSLTLTVLEVQKKE